MRNIKHIIWDFDGVIMNSNEIRNLGFEKALSEYEIEDVNLLIDFHKNNGGLSRYEKFNYFFESILKIPIDKIVIDNLLLKFSNIMRENLYNKNLLNYDAVNFIKNNFKFYDMHIVSASDEKELIDLLQFLDLSFYFKSVNGSPKSKIMNVSDVITNYKYIKDNIILIGDSINDYDASCKNNIKFYGYNNNTLKSICNNYISTFLNFTNEII